MNGKLNQMELVIFILNSGQWHTLDLNVIFMIYFLMWYSQTSEVI